MQKILNFGKTLLFLERESESNGGTLKRIEKIEERLEAKRIEETVAEEPLICVERQFFSPLIA